MRERQVCLCDPTHLCTVLYTVCTHTLYSVCTLTTCAQMVGSLTSYTDNQPLNAQTGHQSSALVGDGAPSS